MLILDTGPLLAAIDASDADHAASARLLTSTDEDLVIPTLVLAELGYWCERRLGTSTWLTFLDDVIGGVFRLEPPTIADLERCRELQETYVDLGLGIVDATVIALAERTREGKVATLDHLHFRAVRPAHVDALALLP